VKNFVIERDVVHVERAALTGLPQNHLFGVLIRVYLNVTLSEMMPCPDIGITTSTMDGSHWFTSVVILSIRASRFFISLPSIVPGGSSRIPALGADSRFFYGEANELEGMVAKIQPRRAVFSSQFLEHVHFC